MGNLATTSNISFAIGVKPFSFCGPEISSPALFNWSRGLPLAPCKLKRGIKLKLDV
jgi:hypothetical protein